MSEDRVQTQAVLNISVKKEPASLEAGETTNAEIPSSQGNPPNSEVLRDLPRYLNLDHKADISLSFREFPSINCDVPGSCNILAHDIQLIDPNQKPIKKAPYGLSSYKTSIMEKKIQYLLENGLAEESVLPWVHPAS